MNVFFIPSWYPGIRNKVSGNFFKEQASILAKSDKNINFFVSLWGTDDFYLSLKSLSDSYRAMWNYIKSKKRVKKLFDNLYEIYSPKLLWTDKMNGYTIRILKRNFYNYQKTVNSFGKIDLIHAQSAYPGGYCAMKIAEKENIPYIITEHMGPFPFPQFQTDGGIADIIKEPYKNASARIAVSNSLKREMEKYDIGNVDVVHNSVRDEFFKIEKKEKRVHGFTFFTLSPVTEMKGITDLIEAAEVVCRKEDKVNFRISGDGDELLNLKDKINGKNLTQNVVFLGNLSFEEILNEYQKCDCFILPSRHESFGIVYAEAAASGKPIIATKCGGPEDIVNVKNGILVNTGDINEMAEACLKIIENGSKYDSDVIREDAASRFSGEVIAAQIKIIYDRVLNG